MEQLKSNKIAIVAMEGKFPGADNVEELWSICRQGKVGTSKIDPTKNENPISSNKGWVGVEPTLNGIDQFDAEFFSTSPREAKLMSPEQRLLLEVAWHTFERAGIKPFKIKQRVGVFVGGGPLVWGYGSSLGQAAKIQGRNVSLESFSMDSNFLATKISYKLGLRGPAVVSQSACSTGLLNIHLARHSILQGDCDLALAGASSIRLPHSVGYVHIDGEVESPDGMCRPLDSDASGTLFGSAVTLVLLAKEEAVKNLNLTPLAWIIGSAANNDGRDKISYTASSGRGISDVVSSAIQSAGIGADSIGYVEIHGTATKMGDPVEIQALTRAFRMHAKTFNEPIFLGAIKANIGHVEAAAGTAGLIKAVKVLQTGIVPPVVNFETGNPKILWNKIPFKVPKKVVKFPDRKEQPRRAGITSLGVGGTNVHVILEAAIQSDYISEIDNVKQPPCLPLIVSGKNQVALRENVKQIRNILDPDRYQPLPSLKDLTFSLATTRTNFSIRMAYPVTSKDADDGYHILLKSLQDFENNDLSRSKEILNSDQNRITQLAFLFTGQGSQYLNMAKFLYEEHPLFKRVLDNICSHFDLYLKNNLTTIIFADPKSKEACLLDRTLYTQPALFAIEVSLYRLFESWGIIPQYVMGHSIGELAAAHVAGIFSLEDGCKLVAKRGSLMDSISSQGSMASVQASESMTREAIVQCKLEEHVSIAALNSPMQTVISGDAKKVDKLVLHFEKENIKVTRLTVSHAFHSHHMDTILDEFREVAESITYHRPKIGLISNLSGKRCGEEVTSVQYWVDHIRNPVNFLEGMRSLEELNVNTFLELGPQPILTGIGVNCLDKADSASFIHTLRKGKNDFEETIKALSALHVRGGDINWEVFFEPYGGKRIDLPTYAFQRKRYWLDESNIRQKTIKMVTEEHPLLGEKINIPDTGITIFTTSFSLQNLDWLKDHVVFNETIIPGATFVEMMWAVKEALALEGSLENILFTLPIFMPKRGELKIQIKVEEKENGFNNIAVYSKIADDSSSPWLENASGKFNGKILDIPTESLPLLLKEKKISLNRFYENFSVKGLTLGVTFQGLTESYKSDACTYYHINTPTALRSEGYFLHPALLDACFQTLGLTTTNKDRVYLPIAIGEYQLFSPPSLDFWVETKLVFESDELVKLDLNLFDNHRFCFAKVKHIQFKAADTKSLKRQQVDKMKHLFSLKWVTVNNDIEQEIYQKERVWILWSSNLKGPLYQRVSNQFEESNIKIKYLESIKDLSTDNNLPIICLFEQSDNKVIQNSHSITNQALLWLQKLIKLNLNTKVFWLRRENDLATSTLTGLFRTALTEFPELDLRLIHLSEDVSREAFSFSLSMNSETELLALGKEIKAPRLHSKRDDTETMSPPVGQNYQLRSLQEGTLDKLNFETIVLPEVSSHEVKVRISASGLNFRDVLNVLGMVTIPWLGLELAGIVEEVGDNVTHLRKGDRVMGLGKGTFADKLVVDAKLLVKIPSNMSDKEAATVPVAFITALYALRNLGQLKKGEKILIHSATGGVGMAALQLANLWECEIFATASESKWSYLKEFGLQDDHISSSRNLDFADIFYDTSKQKGVDLVLNSLAGEFTDRSLSLLAPNGRFLEMGKTDIRSQEELAKFRTDVDYKTFDLSEVPSEEIHKMLKEITLLFKKKQVRTLPFKEFQLNQASKAFRHMSQAKHIGKIIIIPTKSRSLMGEGYYLITGGLGAIGKNVARWLAEEQKVKKIVLISRRGEKTTGAIEFKQEIESLGTELTISACDVSDKTQLSKLLQAIDIPLRGIFHTAGVLDDTTIQNLSHKKIRNVFLPKLDGAYYLHELTKDLELDYLVLFSSISGIVGSKGQANYAAANCFLDALAKHRKDMGLVGTSIAWGPWAEGGMMDSLSQTNKKLIKEKGFDSFIPDEGIDILQLCLEQDLSNIVATKLRQDKLAKSFEVTGIPTIFKDLIRNTNKKQTLSTQNKYTLTWSALGSIERLTVIENQVSSWISDILGIEDDTDYDPEDNFYELGLDSLMLVELNNILLREVGDMMTISSVLELDYPNISNLTNYLSDLYN